MPETSRRHLHSSSAEDLKNNTFTLEKNHPSWYDGAYISTKVKAEKKGMGKMTAPPDDRLEVLSDSEEIQEALMRVKPNQRKDYLPGGYDQAEYLVHGIQSMIGEKVSCRRIMELYVEIAERVTIFQSISSRSKENIRASYADAIPETEIDEVINFCREVCLNYGQGDAERGPGEGPSYHGAERSSEEDATEEQSEDSKPKNPAAHRREAGPSTDRKENSAERSALVGKTIQHRVYGEGYVRSLTGDLLTVDFEEGSRDISLATARKYMDFYVVDEKPHANRPRMAKNDEEHDIFTYPEPKPRSRILSVLLIFLLVAALAAGGIWFFLLRDGRDDIRQLLPGKKPAEVVETVTPEPPPEPTPTPMATLAPTPFQSPTPTPYMTAEQSQAFTPTAAVSDQNGLVNCDICGKLMISPQAKQIELSQGVLQLCEDCYRDLTERLGVTEQEDATLGTGVNDVFGLAATEPAEEPAERVYPEFYSVWKQVYEINEEEIWSQLIPFPLPDSGIEQVAYFPELQIIAVSLSRAPLELNLFSNVPEDMFWNFYEAAYPYAFYWNRIYERYQRSTIYAVVEEAEPELTSTDPNGTDLFGVAANMDPTGVRCDARL